MHITGVIANMVIVTQVYSSLYSYNMELVGSQPQLCEIKPIAFPGNSLY